MVRLLTASAETSKDTERGTTPVILLKIEWTSGTQWYADTAVVIGAITAEAAITSLSDLTSQGKVDSIGEISSISATLSDHNGNLKTIFDGDIIEGTAITMYQHFDGDLADDLTVLLKGRIISEIVWSEGERLLKFEAESFVDEEVVGYAPALGDIENMSPDAVNRVWPLGFGTVLKVPCVRVRRQPTGTLSSSVNASHESFLVDGGSSFPQNETVHIRVGNVRFIGTFDGNRFHVTTANAPNYTNITLGERISNDNNFNDGSVLWLAGDEYLAGQYCYVNHTTQGPLVNYCSRQEGRKCFFSKPWRPNGTTGQVLLSALDTILETATFPRASWGVAFSHETITYRGNDWLNPQANAQVTGGVMIFGDSWNVSTGAHVRLVASYDDLYVFNLLPSIEVYEVFGWRTVGGEKIFSAIPSGYYTLSLSGTLGPKTCSYLTMAMPLEERVNEGWDGSVYVSYRSTVGPNGLTVINHLLTNYTNITSNSTTFDIARPLVNNYWANFVVFDQPKALTLIEKVAWQLRVAVAIRNGQMYYKYISHTPTADTTNSETDIILKSLNLSFTRTEDVYTRIVATWHTDYSGRPEHEHVHIYEGNIDQFGLNEMGVDAFIHNVGVLVGKTIDFWGYRLSRVWRKTAYQTTIKNIELEPFDVVAFDVGIFGPNSIRSDIERAGQDSLTQVISLTLNMACQAGALTEDTNYWNGSPANPIIHNPGPINPATGRSETDQLFNNTPQTPGQSPPPSEERFIVIVSAPVSVARDTNFTVTVELQNPNGQKLNRSLSALLTGTFSDGSDTINKSSISIINGTWTASDVQVTGGAGDDTFDLRVSASGYTGDVILDIPIIDQKDATLSWDTVPSAVVRGTAFSVALSGAGDGSVLSIDTISTHTSDRLYNAGGQVTSITCDALGAYAAADWYIEGGSGNDLGNFVAYSAAFADAPSSVFTISGLSPSEPGGDLDPYNLGQQLTFDHEVEVFVNGNNIEGSLILTLPSDISYADEFGITLRAEDANGDVETTWDEYAILVATDDNGDPVHWGDLGADAQITNNQAIVYMTDGVWVFASASLELEGTFSGDVHIEARSPYPTFTRETSGTIAVIIPGILVTAPGTVTRGTAFDLVLEGMADGDFNTSYTPTGNVSIALTSTHVDDVISPLTTDNTGWTNGRKVVACTVSGGTGSATLQITVTDPDGLTDTVSTAVAATTTALSPTTVAIRRRSAFTGTIAQNYTEWSNAWNASKVASWTVSNTYQNAAPDAFVVGWNIGWQWGGQFNPSYTDSRIFRLGITADLSLYSNAAGLRLTFNTPMYYFRHQYEGEQTPEYIASSRLVYSIYKGTWSGSFDETKASSYSDLAATFTGVGSSVTVLIPAEYLSFGGDTRLLIRSPEGGVPSAYGAWPGDRKRHRNVAEITSVHIIDPVT